MPPSPNLFVVGAMKAGTTTLHQLLDAHPDVFMSDPKEPSHFADGDQLKRVSRRIWEAGYWRDRSRYLDLFAHAEGAAVIGESSTCYAKRPRIDGVAARIAEFNPDARIVYIVRDPVERTISHYLHAVRWNDERRPPLRAIRREPHYREVSYYAMQLAPYHEVFGAERVHVMTLEALRDHWDREIDRLFRWLGLAPLPVEKPVGRNPTAEVVVRRRGPRVLHRVWRSRRLAPIRRLAPRPVDELGRRVLEHAIRRDAPALERLAEYLMPRQLDEVEELSHLLGRSFPEWTPSRA